MLIELSALAVAIVAAFAGMFLWAEWGMRDLNPKHTLDCLDWRRRGERDTACTAHHGTDWFAPVTAELELLNSLDHQIGFRHE